ncbi:MAG: NUDIX hydrolase [Candidatus Jordarchaeum sp.]|uniref:NUDIX hydrolase n=1 Tax=Candidatus Jordarchaeum sp. TaxID=2823881 RepID=UPI00404A19D0
MSTKSQLGKSEVYVTVDVCIFAIKNYDLMVLLIMRSTPPYEGVWALPSVFVEKYETLDKASIRVLKEKAGIFGNLYLEQLYTYGELKRDPRGRVITVAYFAFVDSEKIKFSENAAWHSVYKLPELAFDHNKIIRYAHQRLKNKLEYTAIALDILPEFFTLTELQKVYETILGEKLDKRNFRKKIASMGIVKPTNKYKPGVHRPARLYTFKKDVKSKKIPGFRWTRLEL